MLGSVVLLYSVVGYNQIRCLTTSTTTVQIGNYGQGLAIMLSLLRLKAKDGVSWWFTWRLQLLLINLNDEVSGEGGGSFCWLHDATWSKLKGGWSKRWICSYHPCTSRVGNGSAPYHTSPPDDLLTASEAVPLSTDTDCGNILASWQVSRHSVANHLP